MKLFVKKLSKYAMLLAVLAFMPVCANAEITVKDTISPEFIHNQGYSPEVSRIIDIKTKDPVTPIPVEEKKSVWKNIGWTLLETLDPTVDRPGKFADHETIFHSTTEDL